MCSQKSTCSGSLKILPPVKYPVMWYTHIISYGSQGTLLWIGSESNVCAPLCHNWYFTRSLRYFSRDSVNNITHNTNMAQFLVSASGLNFLVFHNAAVVKGQRRHALQLVGLCSEEHSYDQGGSEQLVSGYVVNTKPWKSSAPTLTMEDLTTAMNLFFCKISCASKCWHSTVFSLVMSISIAMYFYWEQKCT